MKSTKDYIGFSYFEYVLKIQGYYPEIDTVYSSYKKRSTDHIHYYTYNEEAIKSSSLHNMIFLIKNFERELYLLNGQTIEDILKTIDIDEFISYMEEKPNSEFLRKIGVLLENFLGINISLSHDFIIKKSHIQLLDTNIFITNEQKTLLNKKFKVYDNSLGKIGSFNPILLKETLNKDIFDANINQNLENINNEFDSEIIEKAINYLYTKETKGSLKIEGEEFSQSKNRGFLKLISNIPIKESINKDDVLKYFNTIYNDTQTDYRNSQNYIGSGNGFMGENIIEYISPKPQDLNQLMDELFYFYDKNKNNLNPILLATILSIQFVIIHPFLDGEWEKF